MLFNRERERLAAAKWQARFGGWWGTVWICVQYMCLLLYVFLGGYCWDLYRFESRVQQNALLAHAKVALMQNAIELEYVERVAACGASVMRELVCRASQHHHMRPTCSQPVCSLGIGTITLTRTLL